MSHIRFIISLQYDDDDGDGDGDDSMSITEASQPRLCRPLLKSLSLLFPLP